MTTLKMHLQPIAQKRWPARAIGECAHNEKRKDDKRGKLVELLTPSPME